jgi:hypothetical protein
VKHAAIAIGVILLTFATAATAAITTKVTIGSLPSHVVQGQLQHLNAVVRGPSPRCTLSINSLGGQGQVLGAKRVLRHKVAWAWQVPPTAAVGTAVARVACGKAGRGVGHFTVDKRLVPADVTVAKSGLTQVLNPYGSETDVSYGLILVNHSQDEDATDVEIDINLLDAAGNAVASERGYLAAIPAGGTFYYGDWHSGYPETAITALAATIRIGQSKPRAISAPAISNVRITTDPYDYPVEGGTDLEGDVINQGTSDLSSLALITAVFFDAAGNVIGGASTFPPFGLPPGAQAAFEMDSPVQASAVASTGVSAEPEYDAP